MTSIKRNSPSKVTIVPRPPVPTNPSGEKNADDPVVRQEDPEEDGQETSRPSVGPEEGKKPVLPE